MPKVTFEYDLHDDYEELEMHRRCGDMYSALFEIYNMVRTELKHGDEELSDHIDQLLERIKQEAGEFV
jgi:hypothetical protein